MCARPGENNTTTFTLPSHIERGLSELESAEEVCTFFSLISQEYDPLNIDTLPDRVKIKILYDSCDHLSVSEHEIYNDIKHSKKTFSVPGDIPINILEEFLPEFVTPITSIFNEAICQHEWPESYKKEFHIPINKIPVPETEDDF